MTAVLKTNLNRGGNAKGETDPVRFIQQGPFGRYRRWHDRTAMSTSFEVVLSLSGLVTSRPSGSDA